MVERWSLGVDGYEAELFECGPQRSVDQYGLVVVHFREQVDVWVRRETNPCAIIAAPPARARVWASGRLSAVLVIKSCKGSSGTDQATERAESMRSRQACRTQGGRYIWSQRSTSAGPLISLRTSSAEPSTSTIS